MGDGSAMEVSRRPSTGKLLELTPLWESVLRYNRLPDHVDRTILFSELGLRLTDPEWEVRQHALRVLVDVIPVVGSRELDSLMIPSVLTEVALNLGHSAPGVRKCALDVLMSYLQNTSDPEFVLRSVVTVGLDSPTANNTLTTNVISSLPTLIDGTVSRGENISHQSLVHLVTSISKKLTQMSTQQDVLDTLTKIRDHVGENRFDHFLESYYPEVKRDLDVLNKVYQVNVRDSGIDLQSFGSRSESNSPKIENDGSSDDGRKIVLQEEISFEDGSVTMTVVEEDVDDDKKLPRRVRFGGEVVKVRTPDSDVTIEMQESIDLEKSNAIDLENGEEEEDELDKENKTVMPTHAKDEAFSVIPTEEEPEVPPVEKPKTTPKKSQIPVPIVPALHMPHARRSRYLKEDIPTWDGGESLTSSSEGEQDMLRIQEVDLANLSFLPSDLLQLLHNKDDWRAVSRGLDSILDLRLNQKEWRALTVYLTSRLSEQRPARLLAATLRAVGRCIPKLPPRALEPLLPWLVPAVARRLGSAPLSAKLEAALALQTLMRTVGPALVVKVLISERCLTSRSSKLRENSLLGLLYALMTYPSSDFDTALIAEKVMSMAPTEPKRRVRQAILEILAVLAQFVPRQNLILTPERLAAIGGADFSEALAVRLTRRILPVVSPDGLVLYALHIPAMTGRDVDWVLSGSGSLSSGSARSRSQLDLAQREVYFSTSKDVFSGWSKDDMMAVGTALPPRNFTYSHSYGEDRYYDQVWAAEPRQGLHFSSSQSSTRPLYLRYQNGQSDLQRGNVPDQGFPQLSSSYNSGLSSIRRQADLSQTWSGSRWGESPPHVSINQSLPPIGQVNEWRTSRWQPQISQVDPGTRIITQDEQRKVGRWSRRADLPKYQSRIITPSSQRVVENGLRKSPVVSRSESCLVSPELVSQAGAGDLARSTPSLTQPQEEQPQSLSRQESPQSSSVSSSLASVASQQLSGNQENESQNANEEQIFRKGGTENLEDIPDNDQNEVEDAVENSPAPTEVVSNEVNDIDENDNAVDIEIETPEIETPDTKSLGTPSSEFGSESSKTTETSGNTIECNNNADDKPIRRIPRSIEPERNNMTTTQKVSLLSTEDARRMFKRRKLVAEIFRKLCNNSSSKHDKIKISPSNLLSSMIRLSKTNVKKNNATHSVRNDIKKHTEKKDALVKKVNLRSRGKNSSKERPPLFPPTLPPFENPKDAFLKTLLQLENPEWEVVMQGLQGLVRLSRHHSKFLAASAHSVVTATVHNIRNLRSQVSRGACQASKEIFDSIGRFLDSEVEDLAAALLSRTADTNKFLRGDALAALESMVDHTNPVRSIGILANKGLKHQNALVRCATSRLLLRLSKRLGAERCLSLPRDTRDLLILTGAKLLTEGSLDTRRYSKEMFQVLSSDGRLLSVMSEVVPNNVLRNISKVLSKITITNKK